MSEKEWVIAIVIVLVAVALALITAYFHTHPMVMRTGERTRRFLSNIRIQRALIMEREKRSK